MSWTLVVHGGAGAMTRAETSDDADAGARAGLSAALAAGGAILAAGGNALDAVEAAVRALEDDPQFNAGRGAVFTAAGAHELDAAIMCGATRCAGAVAGVTRTRNPVSLARTVMTRSKHVMLVGAGADAFALDQGLDQVDQDYFSIPERRAQLERLRARDGSAQFDAGVKFGTVGAVARDSAGRLAAATSTGGLTGKHPGRVGDTPVIGAGTYADDRGGAVSATGSGEYYVRVGVAHEICARVRFLGESAQAAADAVQAETKALGGDGGVIMVAPDGTPAWSFTTPGMYRGALREGGAPAVAIYGDEG